MSRFLIACVLMIGLHTAAYGQADPPYAHPKDGQWKTIVVDGVRVGQNTFRYFAFFDAAPAVRWFEATPVDASIDKFGEVAGVISCSVLVEVPRTKYETGFGGKCVLRMDGKDAVMKVCSDTGVGNARIEAAAATAGEADVAKFTVEHCSGG